MFQQGIRSNEVYGWGGGGVDHSSKPQETKNAVLIDLETSSCSVILLKFPILLVSESATYPLSENFPRTGTERKRKAYAHARASCERKNFLSVLFRGEMSQAIMSKKN